MTVSSVSDRILIKSLPETNRSVSNINVFFCQEKSKGKNKEQVQTFMDRHDPAINGLAEEITGPFFGVTPKESMSRWRKERMGPSQGP
jgi:hypothetical protein